MEANREALTVMSGPIARPDLALPYPRLQQLRSAVETVIEQAMLFVPDEGAPLTLTAELNQKQKPTFGLYLNATSDDCDGFLAVTVIISPNDTLDTVFGRLVLCLANAVLDYSIQQVAEGK